MAKFCKEEVEQLVNTLCEMGVKPKAESPEELTQWMTEYVKSKSKDTSKCSAHTKVIYFLW